MNDPANDLPIDVRVVLMARHPIPGKAKTRLMPALSPEQAAAVQGAFVRHWGDRLGDGTLNPQVFFDPPEAAAQFIQLLPPTLHPLCQPQAAGDLTARLAAACTRLRERLSFVPCFIGTDSPDVPQPMLVEAIRMTRPGSVVIGPAGDGGFWCLGLGQGVDPETVLTGIEWSSGREGAQVVAAARRAGYDVRLAGMWDDVDRPDDLRRLIRRLRGSRSAADRRLLQRLRFLPKEFVA